MTIMSHAWKSICLVILAVTALPTVSAEDAPNTIALPSGATFPCRVGGIDATGWLSLTAPIFRGPTRLRTAGLAEIRLNRTKAEPGGASLVLLTNGDTLVGKLTTLDGDVVSLETVFGPLDIPREVVHAVDRRRTFAPIVESDFRGYELERWNIFHGSWTRKGKAARSSGEYTYTKGLAGSWMNVITRELPHEGPVTLIARVDGSMTPRQKTIQFLLYAQEAGGDYNSWAPGSTGAAKMKKDCMLVQFSPHGCTVTTNPDGIRHVVFGYDTSFLEAKNKGELRFTYDPESGAMRAWVNGIRVLDRPNQDTLDVFRGRCVAVRTGFEIDLYTLGLYSGIIPPDAIIQPRLFAQEKPIEEEGKDNYRLILANGDSTFAGEVELLDDTLALVTDAGDFKMPWNRVVRLVTPLKDRKPLPPGNQDVRVHLERSTITIKLDQMSATELTGTTPYGCRLRIPRAAVARITPIPSGPSKVESNATVELTDGAVLPCTLGRIANDHVGIRTPWIDGEAALNRAAVVSVTLRAASPTEPGRDTIMLTDGSRIVGTLTGIGADAVAFNADVAGKLSIPRKHVRTVARDLIGAVDFRTPQMGKWVINAGKWERKKDGLHSTFFVTPMLLSRPLKQNGPITIDVTGIQPPGTVTLFAKAASMSPRAAGGISLRYYPVFSYWGVGGAKERQIAPSTGGSYPSKWHGTSTTAYDPATGELSVWGDGKFVGRVKAGNGPRAGKYILLNPETISPITYESVYIWKGIAPNGTLTYLDKVEGDAVVAMDGNHTTGADLRMTDGTVTMTSADKQHKATWEEVRAIGLAKSARTKIERKPEHALVIFDRSEIILRIESLTDKHLTGTVPAGGSVRIPRAQIKSIQMLAPDHPTPYTPPPPRVWKRPPGMNPINKAKPRPNK